MDRVPAGFNPRIHNLNTYPTNEEAAARIRAEREAGAAPVVPAAPMPAAPLERRTAQVNRFHDMYRLRTLG